MTFGAPYLLLSLLAIPLAIVLWRTAERRRMRYAVRYTNVEVLAGVAGSRSQWRRYLPAGLFLVALATLCVGLARPHVKTTIPTDNATVVLVLDVSGSMQANDVKPTRLAAAQKAINLFLDRVPSRLKVGLILFAGEPYVATPPTTDHTLVRQAVADVGAFRGFGGTAIGDALATAVQLGLKSAGLSANGQLAAYRTVAPSSSPASSLVSILFLSDGHQTRGTLLPLEGAARAKAAGIPVYTVALGTINGRITNFPGAGLPGFGPGGGGGGTGARLFGLQPDPKTLHAIATMTGGEFFRANSAGKVQAAYSKLGSSIGRKPGHVEVTSAFLLGAAILLVLAGVLSARWAPRLP
ncbi:MAG TPA: VWA domain-containing protein [Gaiellaceae bacterium]|nr:VWA domain-containing protein [Gaiellaceae bacterium]